MLPLVLMSVVFSIFILSFAYVFCFPVHNKCLISIDKTLRNSLKDYNLNDKDLKKKLHLVSKDLTNWKLAWRDLRNETKDNASYWKGVKYGYNLCEKRKNSSDKNYLPQYVSAQVINLTENNIFTLRQIANGNRVQGYNAAFLEDNGYVRIIWDDDKYHYEITDFGKKFLKENSVEGGVSDSLRPRFLLDL